jgi:hypothetical protein
MAAAGFPDSSLDAIAGWMPAKMTERYSHTHIEAKRDVMDKIPGGGSGSLAYRLLGREGPCKISHYRPPKTKMGCRDWQPFWFHW